MSIPKIIHQTSSSSLLSSEVEANVAHLKGLNPGWEYRHYNDEAMEQFVQQEYPSDVLAAFRRISPAYGAARADFFRYLLMFKVGGVYLDIKSSSSRAFDSIIHADDQLILATWSNGLGTRHPNWGYHAQLPEFRLGEFQQWHIITKPNHPFLYGAILQVLRNIAGYVANGTNVGAQGVWETTGPIAYSKAIAPLMLTFPHRLAGTNENLGLIYSIYGQVNPIAHRGLGSKHYTECTSPVII